MEVYEIGITSWLVSGDLVGKPHLVDEKLGDYTNQYTVLLGIIIRIHERGSPFFEYCSFFLCAECRGKDKWGDIDAQPNKLLRNPKLYMSFQEGHITISSMGSWLTGSEKPVFFFRLTAAVCSSAFSNAAKEWFHRIYIYNKAPLARTCHACWCRQEMLPKMTKKVFLSCNMDRSWFAWSMLGVLPFFLVFPSHLFLWFLWGPRESHES